MQNSASNIMILLLKNSIVILYSKKLIYLLLLIILLGICIPITNAKMLLHGKYTPKELLSRLKDSNTSIEDKVIITKKLVRYLRLQRDRYGKIKPPKITEEIIITFLENLNIQDKRLILNTLVSLRKLFFIYPQSFIKIYDRVSVQLEKLSKKENYDIAKSSRKLLRKIRKKYSIGD